jgi:hypothetical protein
MGASAVVALLLLAAPPRSLGNTDAAVHLPRVDRASGVLGFLTKAGGHASLLRPDVWRAEVHPIFILDLSRMETLVENGIDPAGSLTVSVRGATRMACTSLKDPAKFARKADDRLKLVGRPFKKGTQVGAVVLDRPVVGYVIKGKEACAVGTQGGSSAAALDEAEALLKSGAVSTDWKTALSLPGPVKVLASKVAAGVDGSGNKLIAEAKGQQLQLPPLAGAGASPYAALTPSGMAFLRARVAPAHKGALIGTAQLALAQVCRDCDSKEVRSLSGELEKLLTGALLWRIDSVQVRGSLRTAGNRFWAVKQAALVEVSSAAAAKTALAALERWPSARKEGEGWLLTAIGGELRIGVVGEHLYFANDRGALEVLQKAIASGGGGKLAHGGELVIDPKVVARGLGQVSLLDVMSSTELAGLFAAGTELGNLLSHSERISAWIDSPSEAEHRVQTTWELGR